MQDIKNLRLVNKTGNYGKNLDYRWRHQKLRCKKFKILHQRTKLTITERISTINRGPRNLNARNLKSEISDQNWQLWEEFLLQMEAPET